MIVVEDCCPFALSIYVPFIYLFYFILLLFLFLLFD